MNKINAYYQNSLNIFAHSSVPWQQNILNNFMKLSEVAHGSHILDVGAGIGNNEKTLIKYSNNITAVDVSKKVLTFLKNRFRNNKIKTIIASAENLPFDNETFNIIICTEVLEHVRSQEKVLRECFRLLKPGGLLFLSSPNYLNPAGFVKIIYELFHPNASWDAWGNHTMGRENFTTSISLTRLMKKHNFKIIYSQGGDLIRSWLPFFKKYYKFIDRYPFLKIGKKSPMKYLLMNYFISAKKN